MTPMRNPFKKQPPARKSVRRDVVRNILLASMRETDVGDRTDCLGPEWERAKSARSDALKGATRAEITAAFDAVRRHGY